MFEIKANELRAVAIAASKDHTRPILCSVAIYGSGNEYSLFATDSYKTAAIINGPLHDGQKPVFIIDAEYIRALKATDKYVTIDDLDEYYVKAQIIGKTIKTEQWRKIEDNYPNVLQFIKAKEPELTAAAYNPSYLEAIAKVFKIAKAQSITILPESLKPGEFIGKTENGGILHCVIGPMRVDGYQRPYISDKAPKAANETPKPAKTEPKKPKTEKPEPKAKQEKPENVKEETKQSPTREFSLIAQIERQKKRDKAKQWRVNR